MWFAAILSNQVWFGFWQQLEVSVNEHTSSIMHIINNLPKHAFQITRTLNLQSKWDTGNFYTNCKATKLYAFLLRMLMIWYLSNFFFDNELHLSFKISDQKRIIIQNSKSQFSFYMILDYFQVICSPMNIVEADFISRHMQNIWWIHLHYSYLL